MARYIIQIFKTLGQAKWSNRYLVETDTMAHATQAATTIATRERNIHATNVLFTSARVSTEAPGDDQYTVLPLNVSGSRTIDGGQLPLWNAVRADITVAGGGRPSRKFYRLPIAEGDTENGVVSGTFASAIIANLQATISEVATLDNAVLVDPDGQEWVDVTVNPLLVERKLHRRRAKKSGTGGGLVTPA